MKKLKITINKNGKVKFDIDGYTGTGCDEIEKIEQALGEVTSRENKPEYYDTDNKNTISVRS